MTRMFHTLIAMSIRAAPSTRRGVCVLGLVPQHQAWTECGQCPIPLQCFPALAQEPMCLLKGAWSHSLTVYYPLILKLTTVVFSFFPRHCQKPPGIFCALTSAILFALDTKKIPCEEECDRGSGYPSGRQALGLCLHPNSCNYLAPFASRSYFVS